MILVRLKPAPEPLVRDVRQTKTRHGRAPKTTGRDRNIKARARARAKARKSAPGER